MKKTISVLLLLAMLGSLAAVCAVSVSAAAPTIHNVYDASKATAGVLMSDGKTVNKDPDTDGNVTGDGQFISHYIEVKKGDVVTFGPCKPSESMMLFGYNTSKNTIHTVYRPGGTFTLVDDFGGYVIYSYKAVRDGYVRVVDKGSMESTFSTVNDVFTITVNEPFTCEEFVSYWQSKNANFSILHGKVLPRENSKLLYQKRVLFCGDSISYGARDFGIFYPLGWGGRIGEVNDMQYDIGSIGGARLQNNSTNSIRAQLEYYTGKEYDFVMLHGMVNDAWSNFAVGTLTADSVKDPSSFDLNTFAGSLEYTLHLAKKLYPTAKIGYIVNFRIADNSYTQSRGTISNMTAYKNVVINACKKWGIPYLNLHDDTHFNNTVFKVDTQTYLPDYIHPNAGGYDLIYTYIQDFMKSLTGEADGPAYEVSEDPVLDVPAEEETTAEETAKEKGCGSMLSVSAMLCVLPAVGVGTACFVKRRKDRA